MAQIILNQANGNQYKLIERVGAGAYAQVYRGQNVATKQIVAIKKMMRMKPSDAAMAQKEVQLMKLLKHKNIVRWIDDFKDKKGVWYIVLEYCGKGDLQKYKEKVGKLPQQTCKLLIRGILQALVELHSEKKLQVEISGKKIWVDKKKIAHRDLKLANILINDQFQLKLADFGFSKDFENEWLKSFCGSPVTMAPEVLKKQRYNEKCDVWSLGVITYYLLYDKYPYFPERSDGPGLVGMVNVVTNKVHTFDPNVKVSDDCKDFINLCLTKKIDKRSYSYQLIKHDWLSANMRWTYQRGISIKKSLEVNPIKEAENRLKNVFYQATLSHLKKLANSLLIDEENIKAVITLFEKYYSADHRHIINYYKELVLKKLAALEKMEIQLRLVAFEKKDFSFQPIQIKKFKEARGQIIKFLQKGLTKASESINTGEQLILFIADETQKLMESFTQSEVDEKRRLFTKIAQFLTANYDYTLINIEWGKRQDLDEEIEHINNILLELNQLKVITMINEEEPSNEDIQGIWSIEHHISEANNNDKDTHHEIGKLVLSILQIGSNFNIDSTMQTEYFEINNYQFNQVGFLEFS